MDYRWSYCLNEKQYVFLIRLARTIPPFMEYLAKDESDDLSEIISAFRLSHCDDSITWSMSNNLSILEKKYEQYRTEYSRSSNQPTVRSEHGSPSSIAAWDPLPRWATEMDSRELDYLTDFILMVPGFIQYLKARLAEENLYDLAEEYKKTLGCDSLKVTGVFSSLDAIQVQFSYIMEHHQDAIHYVNHTKEIDDARILREYVMDTKDSIFLEEIYSDVFRKYLSRYIREENPFINNRLFRILFRSNQMDLALYSANKVFKYAYSSPNRYWHNREAVYGCADTVYSIVDSLGCKGLEYLKATCPETLSKILVGLYHLLSRIIYWTDKEKNTNESYEDTLLPVNVQHKLRAYRLRANLVEQYGAFFSDEQGKANVGLLCLSDLMSAHMKAHFFGVVGENSLFRQEAVRVFHTKNLFQVGDMDRVSEMGFRQNDCLSMTFHSKYVQGDLFIETHERNNLFRCLQQYYSEEQRLSSLNSEPLSYLVKDNYSPAYKVEKEDIRRFLSEHGVKCFYHFTEKDKISSIIRSGGLMSSKRCLDEGIAMPLRADMAVTRDIDARYDLEDFARLSFCPHLPKIEERKKEGAELVLLLITTDVALFEETQFTDMEATRPGFRYGKTFSDLKRVHIAATQAKTIDETHPEYWYSQAEVLVKGMIPIKYIMNINKPIEL